MWDGYRAKEREQREREDMLNEKEVVLKERETLLESATRALSDFKRKVGEFTQNVRNAFRWAENRKSEDVSKGVEYKREVRGEGHRANARAFHGGCRPCNAPGGAGTANHRC